MYLIPWCGPPQLPLSLTGPHQQHSHQKLGKTSMAFYLQYSQANTYFASCHVCECQGLQVSQRALPTTN